MKTIADFKKRLATPGARLNSSLYHGTPDNYRLVETRENRRAVKLQSNSFALSRSATDPTASWCDWPRRDEFTVINPDTVQITFEGGKLVYEFINC